MVSLARTLRLGLGFGFGFGLGFGHRGEVVARACDHHGHDGDVVVQRGVDLEKREGAAQHALGQKHDQRSAVSHANGDGVLDVLAHLYAHTHKVVLGLGGARVRVKC